MNCVPKEATRILALTMDLLLGQSQSAPEDPPTRHGGSSGAVATKQPRKKRRRGRPETRVIKLDATMEEVAQRFFCEREEAGPVYTGP